MEDGDLFDAPPSEDDFYFTNGVRFVQPYAFDFVCHVKKRQEGVTIVELFIREFPNRPKSYYEAAHGQGLLRVEKVTPANNGGSKNKNKKRKIDETIERPAQSKQSGIQPVPTAKPSDQPSEPIPTEPLRILHAGERLRHALHRHEPPTLRDPVIVLSVTDTMVAVCKPATVPVHPTGQYRKNTVLGILAAQRPDLGRLLPIHRLDKNVSGLLLLARNKEAANKLRQEVEGQYVKKKYLAVVSTNGKSVFETFQSKLNNSTTVSAGVKYDPRARIATCSTPDKNIPDAKIAETKFTLLAVAVDSDEKTRSGDKNPDVKTPCVQISKTLPTNTALVLCEPLTGRTHQIRVHLQLLGHPIANDLKYGGVHVDDLERIKKQLQTCRELTMSQAKSESLGDVGTGSLQETPPSSPSPWPLCPHCPMMAHGANDFGEEVGCEEKTRKNTNADESSGSQTRVEDLERLFLHCAKYDGPSWSFQAPNPDWVPGDVEVDLDQE